MTIGLGLVCIGAAVMIVAIAALAVCGLVAIVDRVRGLGGARYSRTPQRSRSDAHGGAPQPAPPRARVI